MLLVKAPESFKWLRERERVDGEGPRELYGLDAAIIGDDGRTGESGDKGLCVTVWEPSAGDDDILRKVGSSKVNRLSA